MWWTWSGSIKNIIKLACNDHIKHLIAPNKEVIAIEFDYKRLTEWWKWLIHHLRSILSRDQTRSSDWNFSRILQWSHIGWVIFHCYRLWYHVRIEGKLNGIKLQREWNRGFLNFWKTLFYEISSTLWEVILHVYMYLKLVIPYN